MGELGYTCYLQYMDGEGELTRFTELTFDDINNNSYVNIFCEQYTWDDIKEISTIIVTGSGSGSCCKLHSHDDEDIDNLILYGDDIVMNENLIFPEDLEDNENARVEYLKNCNDMVKQSDAYTMYYDIILPRNEEVKGIIEYGDNLLN